MFTFWASKKLLTDAPANYSATGEALNKMVYLVKGSDYLEKCKPHPQSTMKSMVGPFLVSTNVSFNEDLGPFGCQ